MPPLARRTWPLIQAPSGPARKATALAMSSGRPRRSSGDILASCSTTAGGLPSVDGDLALDASLPDFFARHPGATLSALAEHSGRDKAQLARLVKRLLEIGLIERAPEAEDRRSQPLQLTPGGTAIQRELQRQHRRLAAEAVGVLSAAERDELLRLLRRVDAQLGGADGDS